MGAEKPLIRLSFFVKALAPFAILAALFIASIFVSHFFIQRAKERTEKLCAQAVGLPQSQVFAEAKALGLSEGDPWQVDEPFKESYEAFLRDHPDRSYGVFWGGSEPVLALYCCFVEFSEGKAVRAKADHTDGEYCSYYLGIIAG